MAASLNSPTEQMEETLAREFEHMSMTDLYNAVRTLEGEKVCSAELIATALKSVAKLHSEDFAEVMTEAVRVVGLESCGEQESYLDIVNKVIELVKKVLPDEQEGASAEARVDPETSADEDPDDARMKLMYGYITRLINAVASNSTINLSILRVKDEAAKKVSTENAGDTSTGEGLLEAHPNSAEMEVQPNAPELEVQPNAPEVEVQTNAPEVEVQPKAPEVEVQPNAPEVEVQPNAPELEVQPEAPEVEVQHNAPELEIQSHSSDPEVKSQSSDPEVRSQSSDQEVSSTASSRLSLYMQNSSDGSVADDTPPNYDELNLHRSFQPQARSHRSSLTFPLSSDESSGGQTNSTVGSSAEQSNSAYGSSEVQSHSTFGSSDSQAYSSGPHSSQESLDGPCPHSSRTPAGVYFNLQAGRECISHFRTPQDHQGYLLNVIAEVIYIGRKIKNMRKELEKREHPTDIPWDSLTKENTGKD